MENISNYKIFNNDKTSSIRAIVINGKYYVVASDVAKALGYSNITKAIITHCKNANKVLLNITTKNKHSRARNTQNMYVILEDDICRLVVSSKLPKAEDFGKWIMNEVLPNLRKSELLNEIKTEVYHDIYKRILG